VLRADFQRIPELLALPAPEQPAPEETELVVPEPAVVAELAEPPPSSAEPSQLGLF
jgi:DNA polymerase